MQFTDTYSDLYGNKTALTTEEKEYFLNTVNRIKSSLGVELEITNRDHETAFTGKSKEALGIFYTEDPNVPKEDCYITIDNFFIHECYMADTKGELNLSFQTLEEVICHELAHRDKFRHGKGHRKLTNELLSRVSLDEKIASARSRAENSLNPYSKSHGREVEL